MEQLKRSNARRTKRVGRRPSRLAVRQLVLRVVKAADDIGESDPRVAASLLFEGAKRLEEAAKDQTIRFQRHALVEQLRHATTEEDREKIRANIRRHEGRTEREKQESARVRQASYIHQREALMRQLHTASTEDDRAALKRRIEEIDQKVEAERRLRSTTTVATGATHVI